MSASKEIMQLLEDARKQLKLKNLESLFRSARDDSPDTSGMTTTLASELRRYFVDGECPQYVLDFCKKTTTKTKRGKSPHDNVHNLAASQQPDQVVDLAKRRSRRRQT